VEAFEKGRPSLVIIVSRPSSLDIPYVTPEEFKDSVWEYLKKDFELKEYIESLDVTKVQDDEVGFRITFSKVAGATNREVSSDNLRYLHDLLPSNLAVYNGADGDANQILTNTFEYLCKLMKDR
jgi:hypothetical protein